MSARDPTATASSPTQASDPLLFDLAQRVARLEERSASLEKLVGMLKDDVKALKARVESVEGKVWWILGSVILSILLQVLLRLIH
jgi:hypothetical protein